MRRLLQPTLAFLFVALLSAAASTPSSSWSESRLERITGMLQNGLDRELMVGGEALIWHDGKVVYRQQIGKRDHNDAEPLSPDAIYRIYSMTKPITSVGIMMLEEQGKLRLSDPLAAHLPEFANLRVFDSTAEATTDGEIPTAALVRPPTIEDVLAHKAGFTYGIFSFTPVDQAYIKAGLPAGLSNNPAITLADYTQRLSQIPLLHQPDTHWHYSVATDVLGRVIEVVSSQTLADFFEQEIFQPLGMRDTSFTIAPDKAERLATLYSPEGLGAQFETKGMAAQRTGPGLEPALDFFDAPYQPGALFQSGGAGLLSPTDDYLKFSLMLLNEGELEGTRLLAPSTVRLMRSNFLSDQVTNSYINGGTPREGRGFGLGFGTIEDQALAATRQSEDSFYWSGAAGTTFWIDPDENIIGIFMTQSIPHQTMLGQDFIQLTYQAYLR